jgi:hypothetical protein
LISLTYEVRHSVSISPGPTGEVADHRTAEIAQRFDALGRCIEARWSAVDYDEARLPEIACGELASHAIADGVTALDVVRWVHSTLPLPSQADAAAAFAQPPITVFTGDRFYISVLNWVDGTTTIHEHGFSGALQVLSGSSIHTSFRFEGAERVNDRFLMGRVRRQEITRLVRGDIRPIVSGELGIHSLFHLERPSATVVVRTHRDPAARPAYTYHPPYVAHDDRYLPPRARRRLQTLELLRVIDPSVFQSEAEALVRGADLELAFLLLDRVHVAAAVGDADIEAFLVAMRAARPRHVDELLEVVEERRRVERISALRRQIADPDDRYLLALAMLAPGRSNIARLLAEQLGAADLPRRLAVFALSVLERTRATTDATADELEQVFRAAGYDPTASDRSDHPDQGGLRALLARSPALAPFLDRASEPETAALTR